MNVGKQAEQLAKIYLQSKGLSPVTQNFRVRRGEIDLVMRDGATLVFVEVKFRSSARYGSPLEQVTVRKQSKIKLAALAYLQRYRGEPPCVRFDVVGISPRDSGYSYEWVKGAFA